MLLETNNIAEKQKRKKKEITLKNNRKYQSQKTTEPYHNGGVDSATGGGNADRHSFIQVFRVAFIWGRVYCVLACVRVTRYRRTGTDTSERIGEIFNTKTAASDGSDRLADAIETALTLRRDLQRVLAPHCRLHRKSLCVNKKLHRGLEMEPRGGCPGGCRKRRPSTD
jgi:hypothetical protein